MAGNQKLAALIHHFLDDARNGRAVHVYVEDV